MVVTPPAAAAAVAERKTPAWWALAALGLVGLLGILFYALRQPQQLATVGPAPVVDAPTITPWLGVPGEPELPRSPAAAPVAPPEAPGAQAPGAQAPGAAAPTDDEAAPPAAPRA